MNIYILKKNIENVIMQPCLESPWNKNCKRIRNNGLSDDGKYIMVKVEPDDSSWMCYLTEDYVEKILGMIPEKYRDKLVTIQHDNWLSYSYIPVFDTDTQSEWNVAFENYCEAKAEWCRMHGCD